MQFLWLLPSILIVLLLGGGAAASYLQIVPGPQGFTLFGAGMVIAALGLPALAGASAFASATGRPWRGRAVRAAVVPLAVVAGILLPSLARVNPVIHDITTDPTDALAFRPEVAALRGDPPGDQPAREEVLAQQREAYPDVAPLELPLPPEGAFAAALAAAEGMPDWEITAQDAGGGTLEAVATSRVFHFQDDVVVRVQPTEGGKSRVDVRSRSRFGGSDFGVNAARIVAYLERVRRAADAAGRTTGASGRDRERGAAGWRPSRPAVRLAAR